LVRGALIAGSGSGSANRSITASPPPDGCAAGIGGMLQVMDQERYELVDVIGSGGMATVWRARDTRLGRVVAIKRPHPAPADSATLPRFAREARAAATVSHPNLVSIYDVGEDALGPYLVMEFVDGPSLATTTVPRERVAAVGVQVASALGALHAAGIVHGDVKPGNILVSGDSVKLTDFGIARTGSDTTALTREGVIIATPEYAAPETLATGDRRPAGDVYALGAVLHELVTGSRWSPATEATEAMPPAAWLPVLSGALAKDPDRRPSAEAFGAALARLQHSGAPLSATAPTTGPTPLPPTLVTQESPGHRANGRRATAIVVASLVALAAVAGVVALTDDRGGVATMIPGTEQPASNDISLTDTTATPSPTAPPPTEAPPTEAPETTISAARSLGQDLADLVAREVSDGLDPDDAIAIMDRLDQAILAAEAGQDNDVEQAVRDARRRIDRQFDDDSRDDALALLSAFAAELGVDPDRFAGGSTPRRGNDDDDD
jgi:eukaryotic-like serine/threonine-protein kinase